MYPCNAAIVVCNSTVTMWQQQQLVPAWNNSEIRYTDFTLNYEYPFMLLSHRCNRIRLSVFHNPNRFTTKYSHTSRRPTSSIVKRSPWGRTGRHPYHANGAGTSLRRERCNRHKYPTPITDTADYELRVQYMTRVWCSVMCVIICNDPI